MNEKLPDVLVPNLKVVFCGTAAGYESAQRVAYYVHSGNKFWRTLYDVGLTPERIEPGAYVRALDYGIGLTDLAKFVSGNDDQLQTSDFSVPAVKEKIERFKPAALAFTSMNAGTVFYGTEDIDYGRQPELFGETVVFVLPSPSGMAIRSWDLKYWQQVADFARGSKSVSSIKK